jgi:hypothetical protein
MALVEIQHNGIHRVRDRPGACSQEGKDWGSSGCRPRPPVIFQAGRQNRKYLCAIGNTLAGSQVSNTPSARTS